MKDCNQILVIKDGTIAEQGSHKELLASRGDNQNKNSGPGHEEVGNNKSFTSPGEYASLVRIYQEQVAAQGNKSQQNHLGGDDRGETSEGDVVTSPEKKLIDEGFPARAPGQLTILGPLFGSHVRGRAESIIEARFSQMG